MGWETPFGGLYETMSNSVFATLTHPLAAADEQPPQQSNNNKKRVVCQVETENRP